MQAKAIAQVDGCTETAGWDCNVGSLGLILGAIRARKGHHDIQTIHPAAQKDDQTAVKNRGQVSQKMTVKVDGETEYDWPVSTGARGYETPSGKFRPFRMEKDQFSKERHVVLVLCGGNMPFEDLARLPGA